MRHLPPSTTTPLQTAPALPAGHAVALKPWFTKKTVERGFDLLHNDEIRFFSFQRRYGGLVTDEDIRTTIQMAKGKGKRRFVFRDGECSQCVGRQGGTRCKHVAALALLCLQDHDDRTRPLAELFPDSPWAVIGKYLHDRASITSIDPQVHDRKDGCLLRGEDSTGLELQVVLSNEAVTEFLCLYNIDKPARFERSMTNARCSVLHSLQEKLAEHAASPNEQVLNRSGSKSKQQHLDASLWMYLSRLLFLHLQQDRLQVSQDKQGLYHIYYPTTEKKLFQLTLPRLHTWELLDKLPMLDVPLTPERAQQFSRIFFRTDSPDIEVEHCCRLKSGKEYRLADLALHRYGTRYLVDNHLFSLESMPPAERITKREKGQLSLFSSSAADGPDDYIGFTVQSDAITDFVSKNKFQLRCGRHQVAPEILELKIVDMPVELIIDQYEEDDDWCYLAGWYDLGNRKIRLTELLAAGDEGKTMLPGPTWLHLTDSPLSWFHQLGAKRIVQDERSEDGRIRIRRGEFIALSTLIGRISNTHVSEPGTLTEFLQATDSPVPVDMGEPAAHLRSYQRHGTAWLYQLHQYRLGGILADDMGLGKTHQALALIDLLAGEQDRFLIVCPAAVLYHWPEKQQTFFPDLSMSVHHGGQRNLQEALASRIVITTYGVLRRDAEQFACTRFKLIIFDEMHFLKNRSTATFDAATQLDGESIFGLTGTPVENNIQELETLLSICLPDLFSISRFRQQFKQAESREERQLLQRIVAPFILRRTRKQVLKELPECSEDIRLCELSSDQVAAYQQAVDQAKGLVDELLGEEALSDFSHILTTIIRLKQICNHLCQLEKCTDWQRYTSGKWDEFTRLIHQCLNAGLKVVVFSQFTTMLDIIEAWFDDEQIDFVGLRGSVNPKERSKRINRFNTINTCRVCCASLLAGGTGIDLTGAQVVIHYDRWWNPAKEEQATARVHRMGQRHPVQVYKLVTVGTLEEKIHRLIAKKRQLAEDLIVEDDGSILKTLNRKELAGLFQYAG
jgi:superfamily II DNA or RNA helicase